MNTVMHAALKVVEARRKGEDIEALLDELDKDFHRCFEEDVKTYHEYRHIAIRDFEEEGRVEIDPMAVVSLSDSGGAYVQA